MGTAGWSGRLRGGRRHPDVSQGPGGSGSQVQPAVSNRGGARLRPGGDFAGCQQIVAAPNVGAATPTRLWLRPLGSISGRLLTGTEGAIFPFWSPDGRSIGFFADQKLKRVDIGSEAIETVADAPVARGGAWQADDTILFAPNAAGPLFRVAAVAGAQPVAATKLTAGQRDHRGPFILPDQEHFLYYARGDAGVRGVHVSRLDGTGAKRLLDADGAAVYATSGYLLFPRQGELLAHRFDTARLALSASASGPIA